MKKITVTLSDEAEKIFNDICYSLPKPGTEGELCTQSDAINYAIINGEEMLQAFDSGLLIEPYELPTEEEIERKIKNAIRPAGFDFKRGENGFESFRIGVDSFNKKVTTAAKAITNLLER